MLSTGDIREWDAVVDQVLPCLVLKAPMDRRRQLELHRPDITDGKADGRTILRHCTIDVASVSLSVHHSV